MIVVDASVLAPALLDDGASGARFRLRLSEEGLVAPELVDIEVCSVIRSWHRRGNVSIGRASSAIDDLLGLPMHRVARRHLVERIWQLRGNVTSYDAAYVALAERLSLTLVTADGRLANAPGTRCPIEHIA